MKCHNLSYEKVKIDTPPSETIIYLDPPYKGTVVKGYEMKEKMVGTEKVYKEKACNGKGRYYERQIKQCFDYDKLYAYCHELAQKGYTVYMSEYSCDSPYATEVWSREKRNNFSADKSVENSIERLYLWH